MNTRRAIAVSRFPAAACVRLTPFAVILFSVLGTPAASAANPPSYPSSLSVSRYGVTAKASAIKRSGPLCVGMTPQKFQQLSPEQQSEALECDQPRGLVTISERGKTIFAEHLPQLNWVDFIRIIEPHSWMMGNKAAAIKSHPAVIVGYTTCGGSCHGHWVRAYVYDLNNRKGGYVATDIYQQASPSEMTRIRDLSFQWIQAVTTAGRDQNGNDLFVAQAASCGPIHFIVTEGESHPRAGDYIMGDGWGTPRTSLNPLTFIYAKPSQYKALAQSCE